MNISKMIGEKTVVLQRNDSTSSGYGEWKWHEEDRYYRLRFYYSDYPAARYYSTNLYVGYADDITKMAVSSTSFHSATLPNSFGVQAPFLENEKDGSKVAIGMSVQLLSVAQPVPQPN